MKHNTFKRLISKSLMGILLVQGPWALASNTDLKMTAVGDIIFHGALLEQAMTNGHGFESLWKPILPQLQQADILYGNLEGPSAPNVHESGKVFERAHDTYTGIDGIYSPATEGKSYTFNFHRDGVVALKQLGFSVLSTANNHSMDRGSVGIDKTLEVLEGLDIPAYGTQFSFNKKHPLYQILKVKNFRVAFFGCTFGLNGGSDRFNQVMYCFSGQDVNPMMLKILEQIKSEKVDLIVFTPHWGVEYANEPNGLQKKVAKTLINAGVDLILGTHPHHLQSFEVFSNSNGEKKFVFYSLGNFVTNQFPYDYRDQEKQTTRFPQRISLLLNLKMKVTNGKLQVADFNYIPTYMTPKHENPKGIRQMVMAYPQLHKGSLAQSVLKTQEHIFKLFPKDKMLPLDQVQQVF